MKKNFYLVLDVETANSTDDALVYDLGGAVCDKHGNIFDSFSFVVSDIFDQEAELMQSAYYAQKLPKYHEGLRAGAFNRVSFNTARRHVADLIKLYSIEQVFAYNANFDLNALNKTQRWLTKSKYRYFLPYGIQFNCIWHMACQTICSQKTYRKWAIENGLVSPKGNLKTSAETVYAYISNQDEFEEDHTGLQDVLIEVAILAHVFRQKKKVDRSINRLCWRIPQKV